ncbi:MAG TPA: FHA domain-containing protein [Candidatus Brocadiia bacterium]|nr:FHA domain-containing protein [Candidatus Brocadiia bacterium]
MKVKLVQITGSDRSKEFPVERGQTLVCGRFPLNPIYIPDRLMSRRHFQVTREDDGRLIIKDLGSQNGSRVNKRIIFEPTELANGDIIEAGLTQLEVVFLDESAAGKDRPTDEFDEQLRKINQNNPDDWQKLIWWCETHGRHQQEAMCRQRLKDAQQRLQKVRKRDEAPTMIHLEALTPESTDMQLEEKAELPEPEEEAQGPADDTERGAQPEETTFEEFKTRMNEFGLEVCHLCEREGQVNVHPEFCWGSGIHLASVPMPDDLSIRHKMAALPVTERPTFSSLVRLAMVAPIIGARHVFHLPEQVRQHILTVPFLEESFARFARQYLQQRSVPCTEECIGELLHLLSFKGVKDYARLSAMIKKVSSLTAADFAKLSARDRQVIEQSDILSMVSPLNRK